MIPQYAPLITEEDAKAVSNYMFSGGWLTEFKETEQFEQEIAKFLDVKHCACVNNGTVAISLALYACGVRRRTVYWSKTYSC